MMFLTMISVHSKLQVLAMILVATTEQNHVVIIVHIYISENQSADAGVELCPWSSNSKGGTNWKSC
jgi:hypothetical protein